MSFQLAVFSFIFEGKKGRAIFMTLSFELASLFARVYFSKSQTLFTSNLEYLFTIKIGTHFKRAGNPEFHFCTVMSLFLLWISFIDVVILYKDLLQHIPIISEKKIN